MNREILAPVLVQVLAPALRKGHGPRSGHGPSSSPLPWPSSLRSRYRRSPQADTVEIMLEAVRSSVSGPGVS